MTIPLIDFALFSQEKQSVADQIRAACQQFGFFYLINHGISEAQIAQLFQTTQAFFALPHETKQQISRSPDTNCGYVPFAAESLNPDRPGDLKEAFNVGEQAIWLPEDNRFRPVIWEFYQTCLNELVPQVLRAFALALSLPEAFFLDKHGKNCFLRLLHYPAVTMQNARQIRAGEHTDYGSFTLLLQDAVGGLEIYTPDSGWQPAPPVPGAIVVNIGDAMQRWTGNLFRSTPHRVVDSCNLAQSRYSIALFCDPNPEVEIAGLPSCAAGSAPDLPIRYQDYLAAKFAATYRNGNAP